MAEMAFICNIDVSPTGQIHGAAHVFSSRQPPGRAARVPAAGRPVGQRGGYRWTLDSGPALTGKFAVFTTWMPACCSPLNGVTTGLAWPGSQPRLNGRAGSLNQTPRWNW